MGQDQLLVAYRKFDATITTLRPQAGQRYRLHTMMEVTVNDYGGPRGVWGDCGTATNGGVTFALYDKLKFAIEP